MVERKSKNSDRRLKLIHITEKGRKTVEKANQVGKDFVKLARRLINDEEITNMVGTLKKIRENLLSIIDH